MLKLFHDKCSFNLFSHKYRFRTNIIEIGEIKPLIIEINKLKEKANEPMIRSFASKISKYKIDHLMVVENFNKETLTYQACQDKDFSHIMKIIAAAAKLKSGLDVADFKDMLKVITTKTKFLFEIQSEITYKTINLTQENILRVSDFDTFFLLVGSGIDAERIRIVTDLTVAQIVKSSRINGRLDTNSKLELIKRSGIDTNASVVDSNLLDIKELIDDKFINYKKYLDKPKEDEDVIFNTKLLSYLVGESKEISTSVKEIAAEILIPTCLYELEQL